MAGEGGVMPVYPSEKAQKTSSVENEWVKVKLGDVCVIERGSSPRPIKSFLTTHSDGVNWIKIRDVSEKEKFVIQTKEKITLEGAKKSRRVFPGDLILTNSMSYGRPYIVKIEGCIHDGWFVLRSKQSIYTDYLYYILLSPLTQKQFGNLAYGSVVQNVNGDLVKSVSFPLPPLPEQRRISTLLGSIQKAIDLERRCEESLTTIKRAAMHVVFASANTAGWEKIKLGEILKLEYGKPLPKEDRCNHGGFPAFGANGILCWSKKAYRNEPSIIVGRKGSAGEVNLTNGPFYPTDVTFFVVHNEKKALLKYLYYLLIQLNLKRLVQGIKPGINRNDVYALNTYIPPLHEQQEIVDFLTALDQKLDIHRRKRTCLENIFRLFLHNLTRGTLRLTEFPEGCF